MPMARNVLVIARGVLSVKIILRIFLFGAKSSDSEGSLASKNYYFAERNLVIARRVLSVKIKFSGFFFVFKKKSRDVHYDFMNDFVHRNFA
jgi:hypothetical protein